MAIRLAINGGWLYLTPKEEKNIIACIKALENAKTHDRRLHTSAFMRVLNQSMNTTAHALNILMSARIIKPQQYGRVRLYSLIGGYRTILKQKTRKIGKHKEKNIQTI